MLRPTLAAQGGFYLVTGIWPLLSMKSFELVTGPKTDDWLVQTVGVLAAVIGLSLIVGASRLHPVRETLLLASCSAIAFASIDAVFVLRGQISWIYLADAAAEVIFLCLVTLGFLSNRRGSRAPPVA